MRRILTELTTTLSEFRKNPNQLVQQAQGKPFAVLTNNKPSFYVLTPKDYEDLLEKLWEHDSQFLVKSRLAEGEDPSKWVEVSLDDLTKDL